MASTLVAMASNLQAMASTVVLVAMASNLQAMASTLVLVAMASNPIEQGARGKKRKAAVLLQEGVMYKPNTNPMVFLALL